MSSRIKRRRTTFPTSTRLLPLHQSSSRHGDDILSPTTPIPQNSSHSQPGNCTAQEPEESFTGQSVGDDELDQIIVAIDLQDGGTAGCSYFVAQERRLYFFVILQAQPTVLLVSTRIGHLHQERQSTVQDNYARPYLPYQLDIRPSQEFNYTNAKNKLVAIEISSKHEKQLKFLVPHNGLVDTGQMDGESLDFTLQEGRLLHISSSVDMENKVTIGCAGAILTYLQRRRASNPSSGHTSSSFFQVNSLGMSALNGNIFINSRSLLALQVLETESHPSMVNQGPGKNSSSCKEGLSVYGLFQRFASTPQGKYRLRQIFLRPCTEMSVIDERHSFVGIYLQADNFTPLKILVTSLKHIKNLRQVLVNLQKGISTGSGKISGFKTTVWATLLAFAFYGIDIHEALKETSGGSEVDLYNKALRVFEAAELFRVGRMIQEIVDIDSSDEQGRTVVKPGLDRELDRMKDTYDGLNSLLKEVAIEIASTIPEDLDIDVNVIYFPQLGFNIAIPLNDRGEAVFTGTSEDWELIFITENRAYFKDFRMREMDDKLGDIYGLICEKEIEIVYNLAQRVLRYEKVLLEASDICGEIDSLLAMAQAASYYKLVRPRMVDDNIIKIKGGRHILQELTVPSFVPNDTFLVGGARDHQGSGQVDGTSGVLEALDPGYSPSMLLLTGPNYSGKSVYMKQVALIVYLAQTGSFVPAESATIGIVDKILVKANSHDSVSQIQSTFMNDLQNISYDLKHITGRSLLVIDEFGKGTAENDGIGLACGVLEYLLSLDDPPKVIAATHFHEILENKFLKSTPRLQLGHMDVRICEDPQNAEDRITYLYNFRLGRSSKSFGTMCAAMSGINQTIVDRAIELASLSARGENLIAACAVLSEKEVQVLQIADLLARRFLGLDLIDGVESHEVRLMLEELLAE